MHLKCMTTIFRFEFRRLTASRRSLSTNIAVAAAKEVVSAPFLQFIFALATNRRLLMLIAGMVTALGCNQRGAPPPPKPPLTIFEVAVPRATLHESVGETPKLPDIIVPPDFDAIRVTGSIDAENTGPIFLEIGLTRGDSWLIANSGVGDPVPQNGATEYEVLMDRLPSPGKYSLRLHASSRFLAQGRVEIVSHLDGS